MKTVDDYTIVELVEKYKKSMGDKLFDFFRVFFPSDQLQNARKSVREQLGSLGIEKFSKDYKKIEDNAFYDLLIKSLESDKDLDTRDEKLSILSTIYREFNKNMQPKEVEELRSLILGDKEYAVMTFRETNDIYDYEIITREKPQALDKIRDKELKDLLDISFGVASAEDCKAMIINKFDDKYLFDHIMNKLLFDFFIRQKKITLKQYGEMIDNEELQNQLIKEYEEEFAEFYMQYFKNNLQLFDKEDLLLNTAARVMLGLRKYKGEELKDIHLERFNQNDDDEFTDESVYLLKRLSKELEKNKYSDVDFSITNDDGEIITTVNKKAIKEFLKRCTQKTYYSENEIEQIHKDITRGVFPDDIELRKIAGINRNDLISASKSYEIREENDELKNNTLQCAIEIANYLKQEGTITNEELIEAYLNGVLNVDVITGIEMEEIASKYYDNKFKNLYTSFLFIPESETEEIRITKERIIRLSKLYKELEKKGKLDSDELIMDLIISHGEDNCAEILNDLRTFGIANIEQCYNHAGIDYAIYQYRRGIFMPANIREAFDSDQITDKDILRLINEEMSSNDRKYMSICAIFPGEDEIDTDFRNYLVSECLNIENGIVLKGNKKRKHGDEYKPKSDEYITDPYARLSLFRELDKNYSLEITDDGYAIVECPSSRKVIIEKMLDKDGNPFYGAATYIVDADYYDLYKNDIYVDRTIVRQELTRNSLLDEITPIRHWKDKWGEDLKKEFGIGEKSKYSEEEIARIDEAIARVERSRIKRY